jgi:hypothetical protein
MSQPLDLSVLAQVAEKETAAPPRGDAPPTLPHGEQPVRRESTRPGTPDAPRERTGAARTRRTRPRPDPGTPATPDRRIVPDDEAAPVYRAGILVKPLTDLYVAAGTMLLPISPAVGTAFVQNAQPCAESLDELARTNPAVRRVLMSLLTTGAWGKVIAAHFPIILAIGVTYSPQVRASLAGEPLAPSTANDTTDTVNPVSNGYVRDNRDPRQPS